MSKRGDHFYSFGPFLIDTANCLLLRQREEIPLQRKAFEVLCCLVKHNGKILSKEELMEAVWPDSFVEEANLTQHIHRLRKILHDDSQEYIRTVPGRGYRFMAPVKKIEQTPDEVLVETYTVSQIVAEQVETPSADAPGQEAPARLQRRANPNQRLWLRLRNPGGEINRAAPLALLALILVVGALGAALWYLREPRPVDLPSAIARIRTLTSYEGREDMAAFSPDGKQIAFVWDGGKGGNLDVYVKLIEVGPPCN